MEKVRRSPSRESIQTRTLEGWEVMANWIQKMHMKKGAFTQYAKSKGLSMAEAITAGRKSRNKTTKKRANLAEILRNLGR